MNLYADLVNRQEKMAVIGLGYVGLVLAISFADKLDVIGFDINQNKVNDYKKGIDSTGEVGHLKLKETSLHFTSDKNALKQAKFFIIAVPTPIHHDNIPNLTPVIEASKTVGHYLTPGSIVVYESTVYPGVTEEICLPLLEEASGLKGGIDFKIGYSPERVNPGDKVHTVDKIVKIVSGMDEESLNIISEVYKLIISPGIYKAPNIKTAEAAKVIENAQRDINIAFMNELSIIFDKMGVDTKEVLAAASTKWNFLNFMPGLVGGHCIGVDPYYLTYKAKELGYHSKVILSGRTINDDMGRYIAEKTVKLLIKANKKVNGANIALLGITFKEDCPDVRNSKIVDIIKELNNYGINVFVTDPLALDTEVAKEYGLSLVPYTALKNMDAVIVGVAHSVFKALSLKDLLSLYQDTSSPVLVDVKGIYDKEKALGLGYIYWRL